MRVQCTCKGFEPTNRLLGLFSAAGQTVGAGKLAFTEDMHLTVNYDPLLVPHPVGAACTHHGGAIVNVMGILWFRETLS